MSVHPQEVAKMMRVEHIHCLMGGGGGRMSDESTISTALMSVQSVYTWYNLVADIR